MSKVNKFTSMVYYMTLSTNVSYHPCMMTDIHVLMGAQLKYGQSLTFKAGFKLILGRYLLNFTFAVLV